MRSRNTLLLLVFLLLAGFAAYYFFNKKDSKSTLDSEETAFAVADTAGAGGTDAAVEDAKAA